MRGVACWRAAPAQKPREPLPAEPLGSGAEAIFPVLEGWGPHKDGATVILLGYYNRNRSASYDIPIGPDNRIEPGGPDYGQPTHFEPSQQHGVFAIKVPPNFGTSRLTWTLRANGQETKVSFWLNPPYWVDFFKNAATGNEPPVIRFAARRPAADRPADGDGADAHRRAGPAGAAPRVGARRGGPARGRRSPSWRRSAARPTRWSTRWPSSAARRIGGAGAAARRRRARPDMVVHWHRYRGPGPVAFSETQVPLTTKGDPEQFVEAATTATFTVPGEYVLRAEVTDDSGPGGDGDQCCWTTAHVNVTVK